MFVIHGQVLYGKVDRVRGLFYVATRFFHVYWVPLVPLASYLILEQATKARKPAGLKIPMSGRSVFWAWVRFLLVFGGCVLVPALVVALRRDAGRAWQAWVAAALAVPAAALALLALSYRVTHAGAERALELAVQAGISPEQLARYMAERLRPEDEDRLRGLAAEQGLTAERTS